MEVSGKLLVRLRVYLPWGYGDASLEVLGIPPEGMSEVGL